MVLLLLLKFTGYCSTPLLLLLQPSGAVSSDLSSQTLPFKAYEPTVEIRDRKSRSVFIEVPYSVETGEAERIAVDWTARGGGGGTSRESSCTGQCSRSNRTLSLVESHLQTQRAAVKMLHERLLVLVQYVTDVIAGAEHFLHVVIPFTGQCSPGTALVDHATLRSLSALVASLPATEHEGFRQEFDTVRTSFRPAIYALTGIQEFEDVQLTAFLSTMTKSANVLNDVRPQVLTAFPVVLTKCLSVGR